jgi:hypothetical protein
VENAFLVFFSGLVIGLVAGRFSYRAKLRFYRRFIHERLSDLDASKLTGTWGVSPRCGIGESGLENVESRADRLLVSSLQTHAASHYKN